MSTAEGAARALVARVRSRRWGLATAAIADGETAIELEVGDDPLTEDTLFQIGSVTKTFTGLLLAESVVRGETTLDARVGDLLDEPGGCSNVTLLQLATHTSGLPRLPPNHDVVEVDRSDPYAAYDANHLIEALAQSNPAPGPSQYSNFGYMLLGLLLERITKFGYATLVQQRVFEPLDMTGAICGLPPSGAEAVPGYSGTEEVGWWSLKLPGPGGIGAGIADVARYLSAHLEPEATPLGAAIELATAVHSENGRTIGLGWVHQGGGLWHNGGTGGFRSFVAFHPKTKTAVALLANSGDADVVDAAGFAVLTRMVRGEDI